MSLITLEQAKAHLNMPSASVSPADADDAYMLLTMSDAESIILDYLKVPATSPDLWDETTVPPLVRRAVLLQFGELWRFRGDDLPAPVHTSGDLSPQITNILRRYRDLALA